MTTSFEHDVLIIGSGAAGLTLALKLAPSLRIAVLSKAALTDASTYYAQGGVAAAMDETDSTDSHVRDTLIAGGTNGVKAKVMFAAVWLGGPRWNARSRAVFNPLDHVPQAARFAAMVQTKKFIESYDPSTTQLSDYLDQTESMLLSLTPDRSSPGSAPEPAHESPRQSASATAGCERSASSTSPAPMR